MRHDSVYSISADQPSKYESDGLEFKSPHYTRFMYNMLSLRDLSIFLCNGVQLKFVRLSSNRNPCEFHLRRQIVAFIAYTDR